MTKSDLLELVLFFAYLTVSMNLFFAVSIVLAMIIHELGHAVFFKIYNIKIDKFKIGFFYGYVKSDKELNLSHNEEINLFLAGPLFNFMTTCACFIIGVWFPTSIEYLLPLAAASFILVISNMIPVCGLDGGRIALSLFNKYNLNKKILLYSEAVLVSAIITFINIPFGIFLLAVLLLSIGLFLDESCTIKNLRGELPHTKV